MPEQYFVRGTSKSIYESMTKEEILAAITNAIQSGTIGDIDTGFITRLKEINHGEQLRFWVGTSAEFNALEQQEENVLYIKTDDTSPEDINAALEQLTAKAAEHDAQFAELGQPIKARGAWVFGEIAAGETVDTGTLFTITETAMQQAERNPAVIVSPILSIAETYNPNMHYFGYVIDNGEGNGGTLVFGVHNTGTTAETPPDVVAVVI